MSNFRNCFVLLMVFCYLTIVPTIAGAETMKVNPEIAPYLAFLEKQESSAVDYLLGLFEKYDMVILCERDHRDMTQYEFLAKLVGTPRFTKKVGHIFTEVGSRDREKDIETYLTDPGLSPRQAEMKLLGIYRNLSWSIVWEKTNFFDFLKKLRQLDSGLPAEEKVHVHPCDLSFDWSTATPETYKAFESEGGPLYKRDELMADRVIAGFKALEKTDPKRRKALVIMNFRHAFNDRFGFEGKKSDNTGRFLFEAFPGKVCNVLINTLASKQDADDHKISQQVIRDGIWDAAFFLHGNREIGFSFAGSPFGKDWFDLFPFFPHKFDYQDVFDGMIFVSPIEKIRVSNGIPGIHSPEYVKEMQRRFKIQGEDCPLSEIEDYVKQLSTIREHEVEDLQVHLKAIRKWLE